MKIWPHQFVNHELLKYIARLSFAVSFTVSNIPVASIKSENTAYLCGRYSTSCGSKDVFQRPSVDRNAKGLVSPGNLDVNDVQWSLINTHFTFYLSLKCDNVQTYKPMTVCKYFWRRFVPTNIWGSTLIITFQWSVQTTLSKNQIR